NVELKKKIKTYYGTYKNDKVAGVALTQSQKDYKNFININNENNWIKDFYKGYYEALSWIMIILGAIEFLATVGVFIIGTHGNGSQSQDVVDIWRPVDKIKWKIRLQNIFNALDIITILIGELIMFLKTLWT
ncbi:MAG: hypothetical protein J6Y96_01930, partial [Mycoplasma sp.]|nr:hypothetical protein [Mycoplasma sp.]